MADPALSIAQGEGWPALRLAGYGLLAFPFLSFLINGLWVGRKSGKASGWLATALMGGAVVCAGALALGYFQVVLAHPEAYPGGTALAWEHTWMAFDTGAATLVARLGFFLDPLSMMMLMVIAAISFLVHLYSIGYMDGDPGAGRFFPILSFFTFAMLALVVSSNLIQTFICWELVGVASYLLIGFWYTKPAAVAASQKAFLLTRLADAFFLMGLLAAGIVAGGFGFDVLNSPAAAAALDHRIAIGPIAVNLLALSTLGIFLGAWGKSALFPFHVWLPDAMEGPTPVSSLLHSATMVVAGVFLTARLYPLFSAAETTLRVAEAAGAFTALFAAALACAQTDLKRILAYSTLSQLGLMMAGLGAGVYGGSLFHIFTHAFFKCLLFLSAGVVIHAIHSNDIRDAGGLRRYLPRTYWATAIAVLAIAGVFPFAGFFSKETILHGTWERGHYAVFAAGLATSALTAFYMSRYFFLVFHGGRPAGAAHAGPGPEHPLREGWLMTLPILVLAVPSVLAGCLAKEWFASLSAPVLPGSSGAEGLGAGGFGAEGPAGGAGHPIAWLPLVASLLAVGGIAISAWWYAAKGQRAGYPGRRAPAWYRALSARLWIDEAWRFLAKGVGGKVVAGPLAWIERRIVNGAFDRAAGTLRGLAFVQSLLQSGQVQWYIAVALAGLFALAAAAGTGTP
jgi:NADH-quinone oxidoreductase subunit L